MEIELSQFAKEMLEKEGVVDLPAYIYNLAEREAARLYHIHRCKPKPLKLTLPVGRPRQSPQERRVRELGDILREVYLKQKEFYGEEYDKYFGEQEAELEAAIEAKDLEKLNWFNTAQPWARRKKNA